MGDVLRDNFIFKHRADLEKELLSWNYRFFGELEIDEEALSDGRYVVKNGLVVGWIKEIDEGESL